MKAIFLDIDGVLNCASYMRQTRGQGVVGIDPYRVLLLHRILEATGAKVVVSSSWRLNEESLKEVKHAVNPFYLDYTPQIYLRGLTVPRGAEISTWLYNHPEVTAYAVLDDERDAGFGHGENFFKTDWNGDGLNEEIVQKVIEHLKV